MKKNQIPISQKMEAILAERGIVNQMLMLSNALDECDVEINNLFINSKTLHDSDLDKIKHKLANLYLQIDEMRIFFGISKEDLSKIYNELLETEFEKLNGGKK